MMNGYGGYGMVGGYGVLGWIFQIIVIGLIVYSAFYLIKTINHKRDHNEKGSSALEILQERFARDEITEEEYFRKKEIMNKK